jgi:hypothetical protein
MSEELYFATIGNVYEDGVSLVFDGTEKESQKHYKVNTSVSFKSGDRVKILPYSGTYVVEYVVGNPSGPSAGLPSGGLAGYVLAKASADTGAVKWSNTAPAVANYADKSQAIFFRYIEGTGLQYAPAGGAWNKV